LLTTGDNEILRILLLQHQPLRLDIIACMPPAALGVQITKIQTILKTQLDASNAAGDLLGHEDLAAHWRLALKENSFTGVHAVGFAIIQLDPVGVELVHSLG